MLGGLLACFLKVLFVVGLVNGIIENRVGAVTHTVVILLEVVLNSLFKTVQGLLVLVGRLLIQVLLFFDAVELKVNHLLGLLSRHLFLVLSLEVLVEVVCKVQQERTVIWVFGTRTHRTVNAVY